jgi:hypothetical protein
VGSSPPSPSPLERNFQECNFRAGPFLFGYHYDQLDATWLTNPGGLLVRRAPTGDYVVAAYYAQGAEDARKRAIELYGQILREAPHSDFAEYAKPTLARLQSKRDTGQRQYFCI